MQYTRKARQIVRENIYCTLATASKDGTPWVSPVFFAYDAQLNIYWVSNKEARHSNLLHANPKVAIVIFDSHAPEGEGDGVYFEANVTVVKDSENIRNAMYLLDKRVTKEEFRIKKISEVTGKGIWRIYKAKPFRISKLTEGTSVNGQYIDQRRDIKLP